MALNGWIEIGLSNPDIFASQSNPDIVIRTYDTSASNKIIIGNTSSNEANNRLGGIYVHRNNVGFKKVPLSGIDVDINGIYSTIDGRVASNLTVGYGDNPGFFRMKGDMLMLNNGTSDMRAINSNNTFYFMYSNIERIKFTNGSGMYLNDNVYITNDVYATGYHMTSDSNFKENINEINNDSRDNIDILSKLKVYNYSLKGKSDKLKGFIAQQVEEVLPDAVKEIDNIIPIFNDFMYYDETRNILLTNTDNLTETFKINDELVLGTNKHSKEYFVKIADVQEEYLVLSGTLLRNTNITSFYVHGKVGKMKTIDTNQILALCVCSLQEIIKKIL
jgi:Chaperone of endosialidase